MNISAISGLLAIVIGLLYTIQGFILPNASIGNPIAPKIFPMGVGIITIILGLILTVKEVKRVGFGYDKEKIKDLINDQEIRLMLCISVVCVIYGLIFNRVGYVIATILFLGVVLMLFSGKEKWKQNTVIAICFSVFIYFTFSKFLGVTLPSIPFLDI